MQNSINLGHTNPETDRVSLDNSQVAGHSPCSELVVTNTAANEIRELFVHLVAKVWPRITPAENERRAGMLIMRYGLLGESVTTYRAIGDAYGLTRERVRQHIETVHTYLRKSPLSESDAPFVAHICRMGYLGEGLSFTGFSRFVQEILKIDYPLRVIPTRNRRTSDPSTLIGSAESKTSIALALTHIKRAIRSTGCAQISYLSGLISHEDNSFLSVGDVVAIAKTINSFEWLSESLGWFWLGPSHASRNPIANAVTKLLVCAECSVDIRSIVSAVWDWREHSNATSAATPILPPSSVVKTFLSKLPDIRRSHSDTFKYYGRLSSEDVLNATELAVYRFMAERGGIVSRDELNKYFVTSKRMNFVTLAAVLTRSPFARQITRSQWGICGWITTPRRIPVESNDISA